MSQQRKTGGIWIAVASLLVAMFCFQIGASVAKGLFPLVGAQGAVALRVGLSALIMIPVISLLIDSMGWRDAWTVLGAIQPGMTVTAEIITGESTVFRYLTKPILKTSSEALSER